MAGRKKNPGASEPRAAADYYRLNTKAVEDLAGADESNSPEVSEEELQKYRSGPKIRLSVRLKMFLVKAWFAGAVCFFVYWGLSACIAPGPDILFVFAMALGIVTDLMADNVIRFLAKTKEESEPFLMFSEKRFVSLFLNILYAGLLLLCVVWIYGVINQAILIMKGSLDGGMLGVEPVLFGCFYALLDFLFLAVKGLAKRIAEDAKRTVERQ